MSLTSFVIWFENAESFMRVIIRVIYRITPSYSQLYKYLLCSARAGQVKREQFICNKNILLLIWVSLLKTRIFCHYNTEDCRQHGQPDTVFMYCSFEMKHRFCFKKGSAHHSEQKLAIKLHDNFVYKNIQLSPRLLNPALQIRYLSTMFCNNT